MASNVPNEAYNIFLKIFSDLYDVAFPKKEIEIKSKYLNTPWITKGIRKSSKLKYMMQSLLWKNLTNFLSALGRILLTKFLNMT